MDLPAITTALATAAASMTGLPSTAFAWRGQSDDRYSYDDPEAILTLRSTRRIGEDSITYDEAPTALLAEDGAELQAEDGEALHADGMTDLVPKHVGYRVFTWGIQVRGTDATHGGSAMYLLERARTRLRFESVRAGLRAAGIAIVGDLQLVDLSEIALERFMSTAQLDVELAALSEETDAALGTIDRILLSTGLSGPDGVALPASLQLSDLQVPA